MDVAALLFGGEPFANVLEALMERPGDLLTPSQIEQRTGLTSRDSLYRALTRGREIGLIERHSVGVAGAYRINTRSRIYPEVKLLIDKLGGFYYHLTEALESIGGCEVSFVYGSAVTDNAPPGSDVDLFIIGAASRRRAERVTVPVAKKFGRRVKVNIHSRQDVEKRIRARDPWLNQLWKSRKIFLTGSEYLLPDASDGSSNVSRSRRAED